MDYYISPFGKDTNSGISKKQPWQNIKRVNATQLLPGDSVWFQANQTYNGNITLSGQGITDQPITFSSYGNGRGTIDAGDNAGFFAKNIGGVRILDLNFVGAGTEQNTNSGISFVNTLPEHRKLKYIHIENVNVSGFKYAGISIAAQPVDGGWCGFSQVNITHVDVHDNGDAGINLIGNWNPEETGYSHSDIYIGKCRVFRNLGIPGKGSHSGNGIVLGQVDGATIEHCEVYENGTLNDCNVGGPIGVWTWDSNRVLIQMNESHHNRTGSSKDGGGFDLDGGVRNSIVQYNYSHDNDGAGFLLAQFDGAKPFHNNIIRYNLSENDGRKNTYGGVHLWSTGSNGGIRNTTIYQNTIISSQSTTANPAAVDCMTDGIYNIRFYNNIIKTDGKVAHIRGEDNPEVIFEGNTCSTK